jgi:hypothetical protein
MFKNEKPGGHGERSVAIGTIDMAVWDAVAKIEGKPLFQLLADRYGDGKPDRKIFVYAAGGYYYPGQDHQKLKDEMRSYIDRGYTVVKKKIGGASLDEDLRRIDSILEVLQDGQKLAWTPTAASTSIRPSLRQGAVAVRPVLVRGAGRPARLRAAGHAAQLLQEPDGHRRGPVLDAGCPQPDPLRRHARPTATGCSSTARCQLRPGGVPAHARHAARARLVGRAAASRTAATRCR